MGPFHRTDAKMDQLGFVRGPARILAAPLTTSPPANIGDVIKISGADTNEVQSLTVTGTPTGGTFKLAFRDAVTATIAHNAAAAAVQAALEALPTIGTGGVVCAGGPLPTAVTITFSNQLAGQNVPQIAATSIALTGGTTPTAAVTTTTPGSGLYDPIGAWFDLGGTKNGVTPSYNNAEEEFTIDQEKAAIGTLPTTHEMAFQTNLVQVTPETLSVAWDMGPVTLNTVPAVPEKKIGMGTPESYTHRRIAIVHRREVGGLTGLLRLHFFRDMTRAPIESSMAYAPTGEQQSVPLRMRAFPDSYITSVYERFGYMLDQQPS
jgi:hypothetical protein